MRFIVEIDGPVLDLAAAWYEAHVAAATQVGWSRLDRATFWRLIRTQGRSADVLPGAKPAKLTDYLARFEQQIESEECLDRYALHEGVAEAFSELCRRGVCVAVTLGSNLTARAQALQREGAGNTLERIEKLDSDPRRRPAELRLLAAGDPRTLVAACSDALIRAAGAADLLTVGLTCGACIAARLHQAGASVVYPELAALAETLRNGAADLIRAGMLPPSLE